MQEVFKRGDIRKGMSGASELGKGEEPVKCAEQVTAVRVLMKAPSHWKPSEQLRRMHLRVILQREKTGIAVHQL